MLKPRSTKARGFSLKVRAAAIKSPQRGEHQAGHKEGPSSILTECNCVNTEKLVLGRNCGSVQLE